MNKNDSLIISARQASFLSAGLIILLSIFFIIGYIIGQRRALNEFYDRLQDESFADRVRYSLYSTYGSSPVVESESDSSELELDLQDNRQEEPIAPGKVYHAQLFGCGNLKTAQAFVERAKKLNIDTLVKERKSKTSKGKVIRWYQLITKDYDNREDLQKDVEKIQISEKLKQVKIVES
jgi:hypothetical protein